MRITKIFTVESSHIVRNCTSERCSHSVHGHSYKIECEFESETLDNAQMVIDFGLMKGSTKAWIDSMDHCHIICSKDSDEYREFFKKCNDRWIEVPFNPSAEMLSVWILAQLNEMLRRTIFANGEKGPWIKSVTVWETATGRATAECQDLSNIWRDNWFKEITYSEGVEKDWPQELRQFVLQQRFGEAGACFRNPAIKQQITL